VVAAFVKWGLPRVFNVEGVTIDRVSTACSFLAVVTTIAMMGFASEADDNVAVVHRWIDFVSGNLTRHKNQLRCKQRMCAVFRGMAQLDRCNRIGRE
jgi:hypothetical protein